MSLGAVIPFRWFGRCSDFRTKKHRRPVCIGSRVTLLAFPHMDSGRTGAKIRASVRDYLEWRRRRWWELGGRWHPETVAYSQALNFLNQVESAPASRPQGRAGVA